MKVMLGKNFVVTVVAALSIFAGSRSASAQASEGKAPTGADRRETGRWLRFDYDGVVFRYPKGWKIEPIPWQSAAQEEPTTVGITISAAKENGGGFSYGGRGVSCEQFPPPCKCYEIYDTLYDCATSPEERHIFDLFLTTLKSERQDADFTIVSPTAQEVLHPKQRYTIRWQTKAGTQPHSVEITVRDTSKPNWREATILDVKDVPNIGTYEWQIPSSIASPGPYLIDISFLVPTKVEPPALSGGRIYSGVSSPFYIQ